MTQAGVHAFNDDSCKSARLRAAKALWVRAVRAALVEALLIGWSFVWIFAPLSAAGATAARPDGGATDAGSRDGGPGDGSAADADAGDAGAAYTGESVDADQPESGGMPAVGADEERTDVAPDPGALALPPVPKEEVYNPIVLDAPPPEVKPVDPKQRRMVAVKTILGLVSLLALAYVGGHPRAQRVERMLGISQVITAGFPFVVLGLIARLPSVGILTDAVLAQLSPVLRVGLGWIGFVIGFRFDARGLEGLAQGTAAFVTTRSLVTFAAIVVASVALLLGLTGGMRDALTNPVFLRDALILGTAGAITSLTAPRLLAARGGGPASVAAVNVIVRLQELAGITGLLFIAAFFRPMSGTATWQLPGTAWLLLTLGLGATIGLVVYAILLRRTTGAAESIVLILGSVAFAAGIAGNLRLSPVVVCFMAGLLLVNFPGHYKDRLRRTLDQLERPIYLLFLVVVGALWQVGDLRGWALMAVFVASRIFGKWLSTYASVKSGQVELPPDARKALVVAPMGVLSIAIVVNAQILYPGGFISLIVTAIVGGAIVTEVLVQLLTRGGGPGAAATPIPLASASAPAQSATADGPDEEAR